MGEQVTSLFGLYGAMLKYFGRKGIWLHDEWMRLWSIDWFLSSQVGVTVVRKLSIQLCVDCYVASFWVLIHIDFAKL